MLSINHMYIIYIDYISNKDKLFFIFQCNAFILKCPTVILFTFHSLNYAFLFSHRGSVSVSQSSIGENFTCVNGLVFQKNLLNSYLKTTK